MTESSAMPISTAWSSYRRWFLRGRVFRVAIQTRLLSLAVAGVLCTLFGWWILAQVFSGSDEPAVQLLLARYRSCPWTAPSDLISGIPGLVLPGTMVGAGGPNLGAPPSDAFFDPAGRLSAPFRQFFDASQTFVGAAFLLLCCIWTAFVWGMFGGAITRSVVVQLTREEAPPLGAAVKFASRRWRACAAAPLFPIFAVSAMALPAVLIGLLARGSLLLGGLLWPFALLIGLIGAILLAGLAVGWPLMHAAISAEGSDSFDALSRSYSYVYQRPLHYLLYALSAFVLGVLGLMVVTLFAAGVEELALWSIGWGSGAKTVAEIELAFVGLYEKGSWGSALFWFWHGVIRLIVIGFAFAFFWSAASAIYLLLRNETDGTDFTEIYVDEPAGEFGLPPVATDGAGVKIVPQSAEFGPPETPTDKPAE